VDPEKVARKAQGKAAQGAVLAGAPPRGAAAGLVMVAVAPAVGRGAAALGVPLSLSPGGHNGPTAAGLSRDPFSKNMKFTD